MTIFLEAHLYVQQHMLTVEPLLWKFLSIVFHCLDMDPPPCWNSVEASGTGLMLPLDELSWMMAVLRQTDGGAGGRRNSEVGRLGSCRMLELWSDISLCSYIMSAYQTEVL